MEKITLTPRQEAAIYLLILGDQERALHETPHKTLLLVAVSRNMPDFVTLLLDLETPMNITDNQDRTLMDIAIDDRSWPVVKSLLSAGFDTRYFNMWQWTPFHEVVVSQDLIGVELFLNAGKDPNTADINNNTLLHFAVTGENTRIIEILLDHGADIEAVNHNGETPLCRAVKEFSKDGVRVLLERGASTSIPLEREKDYYSDSFNQLHKEILIMIDNEAQRRLTLFEISIQTFNHELAH